MTEDTAPEPQNDLIRKVILDRYMDLNTDASILSVYLTERRPNRHKLANLNRLMKPKILELIGLSMAVDTKFYNDIKTSYTKYYNFKIDNRTRRSIIYGSETALEMWELVKDKLIVHNVIQLKGD